MTGQTRQDSPPPPTPRDNRFLEEIYFHRYLTSEQMNELLYSPGTFSTTKARLNKLERLGYVQVVRKDFTRQGLPFIFTLGGRGMRYLTRFGFKPRPYFRPSEEVEKSDYFLRHTMAVNNIFVAAAKVARLDPRVRLDERIHELDFASKKLTVAYVDVNEGGVFEVTQKIAPDGWCNFWVEYGSTIGRKRFSLWLEVDRGTETDADDFKRKVRCMVAYFTYRPAPGQPTQYEKRFKSRNITVAWATNREKRKQTIRSWIFEELTRLAVKPWVFRLFHITALPAALDYHELFFDPIWYFPFQSDPVPLFQPR
jgi:hypothetical protein